MVFLFGLLDLFLFVSTADSSRKSIEAALSQEAARLHPPLVPVRLHRKQNTRPLRDECCYKLPPPDGHAAIFALLRRRHPANAAPPAKMAIAAHVPGSGMGAAPPARMATLGLLS